MAQLPQPFPKTHNNFQPSFKKHTYIGYHGNTLRKIHTSEGLRIDKLLIKRKLRKTHH